ncbi:MAG: helix-turn-helix domain-containing protein [Clostridiales bacterium]|nr:helix-turn-helix domain-containing protein [Clostridiales bacterium]
MSENINNAKSVENKEYTVFYTTADIAECLGCSLATARQLFRRADFPSLKIGKNYKVSKDAFEQWAKEKRV